MEEEKQLIEKPEDDLVVGEEELEEDVLEEDGLDEDGLDGEEGEEELGKLSFKQKVFVFLTVVLSFVVFSFVLVPYDLVLREFVLSRFSKMAKVDFSALDINLFSEDEVSNLSVALPNGSSIRAEQVISGLKYRSLISEQLQGAVTLSAVAVNLSGLGFETSTLQTNFDLANITAAMARWSGRVSVITGRLEFQRLPGFLSAALPLDDLVVQSLNLNLRMTRGRLNYNDSVIRTNFFQVNLDGDGRLARDFLSSTLNGKLCLKPAQNLEEKNKMLFDFYTLAGGSLGGELCLGLKGTLKAPNYKPIQ